MVSHKLDFFNALKESPSSLLKDNGKTLSFGPVRFTSSTRCYSVLKDRYLPRSHAPRAALFNPSTPDRSRTFCRRFTFSLQTHFSLATTNATALAAYS